jgi:hypothetical protein
MSATIITQPDEITVGASYQDTTVCSSSDPFPALDVAQVFARIKEHNRKACEGILHIVEAGKLLALLKKRLPHGQFIKMATRETGLSRSTISRYMQIASNGAHVGHLKSGRNALELITELTTQKERTASRKVAPVIMDAEMVEPAPPPRSSAPAPVPPIIEVEIVEPAPAATDAAKPSLVPKWIPDDARRLWLLAKTDLDKILKNDVSRERVLLEVIGYCRNRLTDGKPGDHLLDALEILPHLTQDQLKKLTEAIQTRWMRGGKEGA